jgi:predicted nucleic acid-binding protein
MAARIRSQCHKRGIQSGSIDALIAAMTINLNGRLLTVDNDFKNMSRVCHLKLLQI